MPKLVPGYRDEVKEKILEAAWEVIIQKGTKDTTMEDFAAAMNCSKGALYNYFKNKDELLVEAISTGHTRFNEELVARFSDGEFFFNAEEYFENEVLNALEHMQTTLDLLMEGARNEKLSAALKLKYNGAIDCLIKLLSDLQNQGKVSLNFDVGEAARAIYTLRSGVLMGMVSGLTGEYGKKVWLNGIRCIVSKGKTQ